MDLLENFRNKQIIRTRIQCPQKLNIILDHFQYQIHSQFDKNSKQTYRYKKKKHLMNPFMVNTFQTLNREEKVRLYIRLVTHAENLSKGIQAQPPVSQVKMKPIQGMCECKSFNLKIWKLKNIRLDRTRHQVMVQNQKDGKIKTYNLKNYFIRRSKTKSKFALVLECINGVPPEKSRQVHIAFLDQPTLRLWYNLIREQVQVCQWLNVRALFMKQSNGLINNSGSQSVKSQTKDLLNSSITSIDALCKRQLQMQANDISVQSILREEKKLDEQEEQIFGKRKTFIQHLVNDDCADFDEFFDIVDQQTPQYIQIKKNLDFFHKIMPDYDLEDLNKNTFGYQIISEEFDGNFKIFQKQSMPQKFKVQIHFSSGSLTAQQIFCLISQPKYTLTINDDIEEQTVKTLLKSQNSAIMYQTLKAYNKFYRMRDFVFVRHAFAHNGNFYLVDKSIDNINFPPFMTLVRGEMSALWGIFKDEDKKQITLSGELTIVNAGLLNSQQETNLSLKYLNGFKQLLKVKPDTGMESSMFDIDWDIDKKQQNKQLQEIRIKRKTVNAQMLKIMTKNSRRQQELSFAKMSPSNQQKFQRNKTSEQKMIPQSDKKFSEHKKLESVQIAIKEIQTPKKIQKQNISQLKTNEKNKFNTELEIVRKINSQGFVVIDKSYTNKKHTISPVEKIPYRQLKIINGHAIWKGEWIHDTKQGGMIYINQKKIDDQKGVLKFILTKIGKNILSGKSILNISLPVDIFCAQSNLERLLISMVYAPKLLEDLNHMPLLQKLARVVCFGVSNSVMYIGIEKPFNPILGQTFQCWINGCPAYGEQISHHPPIAALLLIGRGYRVSGRFFFVISGQLESKVQLHMNSGCGTNDGIYKVSFDDGAQICFMTPGGQISGLTFGERKLNLVGKSYYWSEKDRILVELNYQAGKKSFFSKQQRTCDYFEGKVYEVTADFFKTFPKTKKKEPSDKEKVKELGTFDGIWNKYVRFNNKEIFNFDQVLPLRLEYESHPLASDSNWREDIQYRRLNKITRAQAEKQRLQVLQRTDRKFREKYRKKK